MDELKFIELVEKYYNGTFSQQERELFEELVNSSEELKNNFDEYSQLFSSLDYLRVKNEFANLTPESDTNKSVELPFETISKIRFNTSKLVKYMVHYSAASVVTVLVVLGTLYFTGYFNIKKDQVLSYTELKNNLLIISKKQNTMWRAIESTGHNAPINITSGTSFAISSNGYFATSLHIVKNANEIYLSTNDSVKYRADVVIQDSKHDIAILKINDTLFENFRSIPYTLKQNELNIGENVFTLGYSKKDIVFNEGSVSSNTGFNDDTLTFQVSIPANPGNSGGPIINLYGELSGVLLAKNTDNESATFAVPSKHINCLMDSLMKNSELEKPIISFKNQGRINDKVQYIRRIQPYIYRVEVF